MSSTQTIETKEDLKKYRQSLGLSQKEFATRYGVSEITIRRLEIGITSISRSYTIRYINDSIRLMNFLYPTKTC